MFKKLLSILWVVGILSLFSVAFAADEALVGYWKFDEATGSVAEDSSGFGNVGTIVGAEPVETLLGGAFSFDGENDYVSVPQNEVFNTQVFTVSTWLKSKNGARKCAYIRKVNGWYIRTAGGQLDIRLEGGQQIDSGYYFPENEWHHYAITVDNINKTVAFYVDGKLFGDVHTYTNDIPNSTGPLYIGQYSQGYRWKGGIDDVRFYTKSLTIEEISGIYLAGRPDVPTELPATETLVGHWKLNRQSGIQAMDSTVLDNHANIVNAERTEGLVNGALSFDAANEYVEIPHKEEYNSQVFTTAMWLLSDNEEQNKGAYLRRLGGWYTRTSGGQWNFTFEGGDRIYSGYSFPINEWHHHAITVDNANKTVTFYVDGKQVGDVHSFTIGSSAQGGPFHVGQYDSYYRWRGKIDDIRFFRKALSSEELEKIYQRGITKLTPSGHWAFNEGSGNVAEDSSATNNPGTIVGAERVESLLGGALSFDGANDYVTVPHNEVLDSRVFSVATWLKSENGLRKCAYIRKENQWFIRTAEGQWDIQLEGGDRVYSGYYFPENEWHHYAVVVDDMNKTVTFYVDGKQFGDVHIYTTGFTGSTGPLQIGQYSNGYRWKGGVDDVQYYAKALDAEDVADIFEMGRPDIPTVFPATNTLVGHWKFNEETGNLAEDSSIFENHATIEQAERVMGPVDGAVFMDATNEYVGIPNKEAYNAPIFTVAMWLLSDNAENRKGAYIRRVGGWYSRTSGGQWDFTFDGGDRIYSGYYFPTNEWHHHVITIDNVNKTVTFYVDGEQIGTVHSYTNGSSAQGGPFYIGQYDSYYRWRGGVDDVRFYRNAMTAEQVQELYQQIKPTNPTP